MIIDIILDRKQGEPYREDDKFYLLDEARCFDFYDIESAIDRDDEADLKKALCKYCEAYFHGIHYTNICNFINSVTWL